MKEKQGKIVVKMKNDIFYFHRKDILKAEKKKYNIPVDIDLLEGGEYSWTSTSFRTGQR